MPQHFSEDGRTNPLAWAFQCDSAHHNSFTKLMRYEGSLHREFSRALRELYLVQDERRAREAETKPQPPAPDPQPREPSSPEPRSTPDGGWIRDAPQNPAPKPSPGGPGRPRKQ
jgi:hypothetical protein